MIFRPDLHFNRSAGRQRGVPRVRRQKESLGMFGPTVAAASVLAFLGVFYSDHLPAAAQGVISFSRDLGRENVPPAGAYYSRCDEARAAGVAPIYADEPGYRPQLDSDNDGIACEPYRGR